MHTLLPEDHIKSLEREYRIRLYILLFFFLSGAVWIGIGSILPSYIISVIQEKEAGTHLQQVKQTTHTQVSADVTAEVASSNAIITRIMTAQDPVVFSAIIENIANHRMPGIILNDIEIAHASDATNPKTTDIAIRGKASTRDILVSFQRALAADTSFTKVDLPISNLAKGTNIEFSISLVGVN